MSSEITIFSAKKIITMCRSRPEADHVAVRDGRILGTGSLSELAGWGDYTLDRRFSDSIVMPGFGAPGELAEGRGCKSPGTKE